MSAWPLAASALAIVAFVILAVKPARMHFIAGMLAALVAPFAALIASFFVPRVRGDEGSVFGIFRDLKLPYEQIHLTVGLATLAIAFAVTALVVKKDVRLRVAASLILPLAISALVRSYTCAHAFRVAIDDLANVHEVPVIDTTRWPDGVHEGQPFAIHTVLTPAVPKMGGLFGIGGPSVNAGEWQTMNSYIAHGTGTVKVLLYAERGPVRVERTKDLVVFRDEGPSWLPLALGNTWTLTWVHGKPEKKGAVDAAFAKDAPDRNGAQKILRIDREIFRDGLHEYVIQLIDTNHSTTEEVIYRRDGELFSVKTNSAFAAGDFPLLGQCRYSTSRTDDARTLAGPTVCDFQTVDVPYGDRGVAGTILQLFSLGLIDTRPTHSVEQGFVLVHSGPAS